MSVHNYVSESSRNSWIPGFDSIAYGGDYNAEQWPEAVWQEDVRLMREAGVNLVSIGMFSWVTMEPSEGNYDFEWLDRLINLLYSNGVRVDLGTPTASPPAWFFRAHPEARHVTRDGKVLGFGSRGMPAPTSTAYREAASRITSELAKRYGKHPGVVMWHVHNEYGVPVGHDYSVHAHHAWLLWLQEGYGTLENLNESWGTRFWGQTYGDWQEIQLPGLAPTAVNPSQQLDFARFSSDMLLECFCMERDLIRLHSDLPITTNFMAASHPGIDLWKWAREMDIVSNDHYLTAANPRNQVGLAMAADLTRSLAGGKPWMLMEHSVSAVNWQPRNIAKKAGEERRNACSNIGRGADAIMFFQWRASRFGAEKFHSAMLPHAGTDSRIWREVVELGSDLGRLSSLVGSQVHNDVAILWDYESFWAQELEWRPSVDASHRERIDVFYDRLWRDGINIDFALPEADLSGYSLVIAPASYLLTAAGAENLTQYVASGGTLLVSYFSGIVNEHDTIHSGGLMAPLRDVLGVWVEEFLPLREGETVSVSGLGEEAVAGRFWADHLRVDGAEVIASYVNGPLPGGVAITRNSVGAGHGWYVSTALEVNELNLLMEHVYADAGIKPSGLSEDVEVLVRHGDDKAFVIVVNHGDEEFLVPESVISHGSNDMLTGESISGRPVVAAGAVRVFAVSN